MPENNVDSIIEKCKYASYRDELVETVIRGMSFRCSICGKTVLPKMTKIDTGWDLHIHSCTLRWGPGNIYTLHNVCKECFDKEREEMENVIYRAYASGYADILSGT